MAIALQSCLIRCRKLRPWVGRGDRWDDLRDNLWGNPSSPRWGWALGTAIACSLLGAAPVRANAPHALALDQGFTPNPTVLRGVGGGDHPAAEVAGVSSTPTGPCLGYVDRTPHERLTLETRFENLELRVDSALDTTLIVVGPGGVWCNDDSDGHNPAIAGAWLPGDYRIWVGAYRADEAPAYRLFVEDLAR